LLEGRTTNKDELTEGLAFSVVEELRSAPEQFRRHFLAPERQSSKRKEDVFIRTLLAQEGDEEQILEDAAARLLAGEPAPETSAGDTLTPEPSPKSGFDLIPSLRDVVRDAGLRADKLVVALEADGGGKALIRDKHQVAVSDSEKHVFWSVPSLEQLFRGERVPPADLDHYPEEYAPHFFFIQTQLLTLCDAMGDRNDQELEEIYYALRRRPDGRSLGVADDFLWQVSALLLGCHILSGAEYAGLIGALVRSTRKWAMRPISRNYVAYLRKNFGSAHSSTFLTR
jgi:hypothetical protein